MSPKSALLHVLSLFLSLNSKSEIPIIHVVLQMMSSLLASVTGPRLGGRQASLHLDSCI